MDVVNSERIPPTRVRSRSSEASGSGIKEEVTEGRALPLTSSRVTLLYLRRIAQALLLPGRGTKTELLTAIEGRIGQEHEVQNVQVIIQERESGESLFLIDNRGVFLEVTAGSREQARDSISEQSESIESLKQKMKSF